MLFGEQNNRFHVLQIVCTISIQKKSYDQIKKLKGNGLLTGQAPVCWLLSNFNTTVCWSLYYFNTAVSHQFWLICVAALD